MSLRSGRALARLLRQGLGTASPAELPALRQLQQRAGVATGPFGGTGARTAAGGAARAPWLVAVAVGLSAGLGAQLVSARGSEPAECKAADKPKAGLKEYDKEEVAKHRTKETGG